MNKINRGHMLLPALLACAAPAAASAQAAYLEQSGIVGVGKSISITRLPVTNSSGFVSYYDGLLILSVSSAGVPKLTGHVKSLGTATPFSHPIATPLTA